MLRILILLIFIILSSCSNLRKEDLANYDPFYLAEGRYVKKGNPYTGLGFTYSMNSQGLDNNMKYSLDGNDSKIIPLRKKEIIRRVYVYPQRVDNYFVEATKIYMVIRPADWNQ